ncbi:MAG TPA: hypothetical protein VNN20_06370 [Thermodesulfobacteriota bacterium]|nr:hypothetical protein [Thermodesulfobacteriota bacterium]
MTISIEEDVKNQYAKFFEKGDWHIFKRAAEYYLENAARVSTSDIRYEAKALKLLRRNIQKRLYIGIACELLLKSLYLKNGYCINKLKRNRKIAERYPYRFSQINQDDFDVTETFLFNKLMEGLYEIIDFGPNKLTVDKGFRIAKVFRNKEGHVVVLWHDYEPQNYRDIEAALAGFYKVVFSEDLRVRFSVREGEKAEFKISKIADKELKKGT